MTSTPARPVPATLPPAAAAIRHPGQLAGPLERCSYHYRLHRAMGHSPAQAVMGTYHHLAWAYCMTVTMGAGGGPETLAAWQLAGAWQLSLAHRTAYWIGGRR